MGNKLFEGGHVFLGIRLPSFKKGTFGYNQLMTASQRSVTLLAQLLFAPIITRLYLPEAYGITNAVIAVAGLLLPVFTLLYERAMLLARDEEDVQGLRSVVNLIPALCSGILFIILLIGGDRLLVAVGLPALGRLALLIPALVVVTAWSQTSQQMVAVRMRYKEIFVFGSISTVGSKVVAVLHGLFVGGTAIGLIGAEFFLRASQWLFNVRLVLRDNPITAMRRAGWDGMRKVMRKYVGFPKFELPATGLSKIAAQIPLWWLPASYGMTVFGSYSLSMGLLEAPLALLSYSMSQTFYQKAAQVFSQEGAVRLRNISLRTMGFIALAGVVPMGLIALSAPWLFTFFFGEEWTMAGRIAQPLTIVYFARLIMEPTMSVLRVINKQGAYVWFNAGLFLVRAGAAGLAVWAGWDLIPALLVYSAAEACGRILFTVRIITYLNAAVRKGTMQ
jgi:O-antigen/teichoic acid export membrane protein